MRISMTKIFQINKTIDSAALVVIKSLYQNPTTGLRKKLEYQRNIGLSEAFLEAVPTTLIIVLGLLTISRINDQTFYAFLNEDITQFLITFILSLLSASFGLAKCLKNGVAGTFKPGGVLNGLCSVQFLLAFLGKGSTDSSIDF